MKIDKATTNRTKDGIYVLFVIEYKDLDTVSRFHAGGHDWNADLFTSAKLYRSWVSAKNTVNVLQKKFAEYNFQIRDTALALGGVRS